MKITYYVQRYRPAYEAISKEVEMLARYVSSAYKVQIHDLHLDGLFRWSWNKKMISYHFLHYLWLWWYARQLSVRSTINHIYTSSGDLPYLPIISLRNTILTAAASCREDKIKKRVKWLQQLPVIVVETEFQKEQLERSGIPPEKIKLIYPPVDLHSFSYVPAKGTFKILYASCPTRVEDFEKRGITLLLDLAHRQPTTELVLAWRGGSFTEIKKRLQLEQQGQQEGEQKAGREEWRSRLLKNIVLKNGIVADMNEEYAQAHATIIPYTQIDDFLKLIPNSALESLAAGKPLLVSRQTELARIVENQRCGVVFEPQIEELQQAVQELKRNYPRYQQNCRRTAEKLFSKKLFLQKYLALYQEVSNRT